MDVSLGDILGSNMVNVALIIGVGLIVASIDKSKTTKAAFTEEDKNEFRTGLMWVSITLLLLLYLQTAGNMIGLLLLVLFFIYSYSLFRGRKEDEESNFEEPKDRRVIKEFTLTLAGILGVIADARLAVKSAVEIATFFGVPASIIGATLIAFGTSLPELTVNIRATLDVFMEIVMGNIVGSYFLNSTLILGMLPLFAPSRANFIVPLRLPSAHIGLWHPARLLLPPLIFPYLKASFQHVQFLSVFETSFHFHTFHFYASTTILDFAKNAFFQICLRNNGISEKPVFGNPLSTF